MFLKFGSCLLLLFWLSKACCGTSLFIWQVSDVHIDLQYMEGGDPDCDTEGACCREKTKHQKKFAGKYGSFDNKGWCGIPEITLEETLNFVNEKSVDLEIEDFIVVYTGDQSGQDESVQTVQENYDILNTVYDLLSERFVTVYPSQGNHDMWPCQMLDIKSSFLTWHLDQWKNWLDETTVKSTKDKLYYTVLLKPGFRLISLNTNWNSNRNEWMAVYDDHWKEMMTFLESTLSTSLSNDEKVLLIGHVPPGLAGSEGSASYNFEQYENEFGSLLHNYSDTVVGYLVGHEHVARLGVVTSPTSTDPSIVYWPTGSVLNSHGESCFDLVNPSVRLYEFDSKTFELIEVYQFWNNLTYSNQVLDFGMGWAEEPYLWKKGFGLPDLSPSTIVELIDQFDADEVMYRKFLKYYTSNYQNPDCSCDSGTCKRHLICQMRYSNHEQFKTCMKS